MLVFYLAELVCHPEEGSHLRPSCLCSLEIETSALMATLSDSHSFENILSFGRHYKRMTKPTTVAVLFDY